MTIRTNIVDPIRDLAESGKLTGILLIISTTLSLLLSNSDNGTAYMNLWKTEVGASFLHYSLLHWINDGFMAVFFLLVGLEIKREILQGELSDARKAILPVFAAVGGILFPALVYIIMNGTDSEALKGWAIPTATDIAFSLGVLTLLGSRVPFSLKIFLTALAIIDDLGAILIIALFYSQGLNLLMLLLAFLTFGILFLLNRMKVKNLAFYIIPGILLWFFTLKSGIHPTISGVLLAMTIPLDILSDLEHKLNKPVNYLILPAFALANTAMPVTFSNAADLASPLSLGIIAGLFIGKPLGIALASLAAVKMNLAGLPDGVGWRQVVGVGFVAGIGFTMSIFIASLSFSTESSLILSKFSVITGSFISAVTGILVLIMAARAKRV